MPKGGAGLCPVLGARGHSSTGTRFANSPSSPVHISDEGDEASQEVISGDGDHGINFVDQVGVLGVVAAGGGADPQEP
ncbi:hypothetical protein Q3G72_009392 [Acer saccharum]|nr:hypothetical protein Q3G72_009392 [Acer saccharum]